MAGWPMAKANLERERDDLIETKRKIDRYLWAFLVALTHYFFV